MCSGHLPFRLLLEQMFRNSATQSKLNNLLENRKRARAAIPGKSCCFFLQKHACEGTVGESGETQTEFSILHMVRFNENGTRHGPRSSFFWELFRTQNQKMHVSPRHGAPKAITPEPNGSQETYFCENHKIDKQRPAKLSPNE